MRVATEHRTLIADPGASVDVVVDVVNTGDLIDGVTARLVGLEAAVVRAEPEVLPLFPGASGQITLTIQLPASQPAGLHPVTVEVVSHVSGTTRRHLDLELSVAAQPGLRLSRQPTLVRARRGARYVLAVENTGNVALDVLLAANSPDRCATRFNPTNLRTAPGTVTPVMLAVKGPRMITGTEVDRVVTVDLVGRRADTIPAMEETETEPELTDQTTVVLKQRPLISRGLLTALILLAIIALWAGVFLLGLTQVFSGDPVTKTAPASYFPVSAATGNGGGASAAKGGGAGAAPAGATPKTGLVSPSVGGTISGTVTAKSNSAAVGRILVQAYRMGRKGPVLVSSAATQSDGSYTLAGLFPTTYWLKFSADGFTTTWVPSDPGGSGTSNAVASGTGTTSTGTAGTKVTLTAGSAGIQVVAQGKVDGTNAVVRGAQAQISGDVDRGDALDAVTTTVTARMLDGGKATGKPITDTTDAAGGYTLSGLKAPGTYELSFTTPGYQVTTQTETVTGGEQRLEPTVLLSAHTGHLSGTVTTGTSKTGLGGVTVSTTVDGQDVSVITPTVGSVGTYTFDDLPTPGTYVLTFTAPGHGTATRIVDLGAGENGVANVALTAGTGSVSGTLLGPNGKGIGGATVTVGGTSTNDGATATPSTTTLTSGSVGAFTLSGLVAPGSYTLTFTIDGYRPETVPITLSADKAPAAVTAQLKTQLVKLWGTVTAPNGKTYAGATVTVTDGTHTFQTASSDPDTTLSQGGYLFPSLEPGTYSVTVRAAGYGQQTALVTLTSGTVRRDLVLQAGE
ncbi:carboxypeptidase-like regulatory domain-containing protein [Nocardioides sp. BP30]|uniref:carboxypeptidase-like regulatory domain-containing protein n=1 Tax=Nocardioides sp. BP30 TaxID=3036374 RepID=UPI00246865E9|nr:carboxypeptidase-like regulatory domain-containing protein [Nocardioides sp. BP30]WGL52105.1 carboxypeptidase-like regulatory domain-containing protein [Nocardioides sp. BP30]